MSLTRQSLLTHPHPSSRASDRVLSGAAVFAARRESPQATTVLTLASPDLGAPRKRQAKSKSDRKGEKASRPVGSAQGIQRVRIGNNDHVAGSTWRALPACRSYSRSIRP